MVYKFELYHEQDEGICMTRTDIIQRLIDERGYKSYLEIGIFRRDNFDKIKCEYTLSVDPDPEAHADCVCTSDQFFKVVSTQFDIIFIDGLHEHNQVWRDIQNSLKRLNKGGVIVMHDCMPTSEHTARWDNKSHQDEEWYGDVYKAYIKAHNELPYRVYCIDSDCGCGIIDTAKERNYSIAQAFSEYEVDMEAITFDDYKFAIQHDLYGVEHDLCIND